MNQLDHADLHPGDVVLSMGSAWESWLIRLLDGGHYSHAGLYDGERVIMAGAYGIERRPLYTADVYRFHHDGVPLGEGELNPQVLLDQARPLLEVPSRYGYTSLYLVGLLMIMRRLARPAWRRVLVEVLGGWLLKRLEVSIARFLPTGVVAMTCSELVTRVFCAARQATGAPFDILIELNGRHEWPAWTATGGRFERIMQDLEEALADANPHLPEAVARARFAAQSAADRIVVAGGPLAPACFVSPGDLEHSASFRHVGRITVPSREDELRVPPSAVAPSAGKALARRPERP